MEAACPAGLAVVAVRQPDDSQARALRGEIRAYLGGGLLTFAYSK